LERGSCEKIERREAKASIVARGRGKFATGKPGGRWLAVKHFPVLRRAMPAAGEKIYKYDPTIISASVG
jgi:hypothetical protein